MNIDPHTTIFKNTKDGTELRQTIDAMSLYFDKDSLQSKMLRKYPEALALSYTRYMLFSLITNIPRKVLLIGLGGGSFVRFFNHFFPEVNITAVEPNEEVINIAKTYFDISQNKCNIHCGCGHEYLKASDETFDLILIDAFDNNGMAKSIYNEDFFTQCAKHMSDTASISCNTWRQDKGLQNKVVTEFKNIFNNGVQLPVPNRGNNILTSLGKDIAYNKIPKKSRNIKNLENYLGIEFRELIKSCRRANMPTLKDRIKNLSKAFQITYDRHKLPRPL